MRVCRRAGLSKTVIDICLEFSILHMFDCPALPLSAGTAQNLWSSLGSHKCAMRVAANATWLMASQLALRFSLWSVRLTGPAIASITQGHVMRISPLGHLTETEACPNPVSRGLCFAFRLGPDPRHLTPAHPLPSLSHEALQKCCSICQPQSQPET